MVARDEVHVCIWYLEVGILVYIGFDGMAKGMNVYEWTA